MSPYLSHILRHLWFLPVFSTAFPLVYPFLFLPWVNKQCRMRVGSGTYCCFSSTTLNPHLDRTVFGFPETSCTPQIAPLIVRCEFSLGWGGVSLRFINVALHPQAFLVLASFFFFLHLSRGSWSFVFLHLWCVYITNPSMSFSVIWFSSFHSHFYYSFF